MNKAKGVTVTVATGKDVVRKLIEKDGKLYIRYNHQEVPIWSDCGDYRTFDCKAPTHADKLLRQVPNWMYGPER